MGVDKGSISIFPSRSLISIARPRPSPRRSRSVFGITTRPAESMADRMAADYHSRELRATATPGSRYRLEYDKNTDFRAVGQFKEQVPLAFSGLQSSLDQVDDDAVCARFARAFTRHSSPPSKLWSVSIYLDSAGAAPHNSAAMTKTLPKTTKTAGGAVIGLVLFKRAT